ncbi:MAG: hypothetical protein DRN81_01095, partial [Thermoproteota archaeon]
SNYIVGAATDTSNLQASGTTPPSTSDSDYYDDYGVGGSGGATSTAGSNGNDGRIVILIPDGELAGTFGEMEAGDTDNSASQRARAFGGISPDRDNMLLDKVFIRVGNSHTAQGRVAVYSGPAQGNCLNFDGSPEYVDLGNDSVFNFTNNFTLEAWIYVPSDHGGSGVMRFIGSRSGDNGIGLGYNTSNGYIRYTSFGKHDYESNQQLPLDRWVHVAVIINSSNNATFYYDGQTINTVNNSNPATTTGINMTLGQAGNGTEYFVGKLDEVRMWSDVRTQTELYDNMHIKMVGNEANLVGYWQLDETSGTTAADKTSNDNDGTLTNMEDADWQTSGVVFVPESADLIADLGQTSGSATNTWLELDANQQPIPKNKTLWIAFKYDAGFSVRYFSSPVNKDFQEADGRWWSDSLSADPTVAYPSTWPATDDGSYALFWYSAYLQYSIGEGVPKLLLPAVCRGVANGVGRGIR